MGSVPATPCGRRRTSPEETESDSRSCRRSCRSFCWRAANRTRERDSRERSAVPATRSPLPAPAWPQRRTPPEFRAMSCTVISRGTFGRFPPKGTADGAMMSQPPLSCFDVVVAFPRLGDAGLATGVSKLDAGDGPVLLEEAADAGERLNMVIEIDAAVGGADPAFGRDGGGLDHHQPSAAHGTGAEMDEVPIVREAVVRRILAHRRHGDAVSQNDILQPELLKQTRHFCCLLFVLEVFVPDSCLDSATHVHRLLRDLSDDPARIPGSEHAFRDVPRDHAPTKKATGQAKGDSTQGGQIKPD